MNPLKLPLSSKVWTRAIAAALGAVLLAGPIGPAGIGPVPAHAATPTYPQWEAQKAYSGGTIVSYNGKLYKAKWWTQNVKPDTAVTNPWDSPWELIGNDTSGGGGDNTTDTTAPTAPTALAASATTSSSVTLTWTASTDNVGVKEYRISRGGTQITTTTALTFTDSNLQADTNYSYEVKAVDAAGNVSAAATLSVKTSTSSGGGGNTGGPISVGQSRVLTDAQIQSAWGGIDAQYSPNQAVQAVQSALPQAQYEALFPLRIGSPEWHTVAKGQSYYNANQTDYYSYANLIAAVTEIANIKYKIVYREGSLWSKQVYRLDKTQKKETLLTETDDFNASWNVNKPVTTQIVDFGSFLKQGSEKDRKRELAAFLANIAHETGGGWDTAPGGTLRWGLYWNEEISYIGGKGGIGYVEAANKEYPPVAGKSYHGRGPIQLSWNYNYGLFSSVLYGDKNVLLQAPEKVTQDGKLGFQTALLFWLTPQAPKPSAHDVMVGAWKPSAAEIAKGLTPPGFGVTIMIINGGLEGNKDETDYRISRRVGHYRDITSKMGVDITGEKLNTLGMQPF